jgi:hypothetical protein
MKTTDYLKAGLICAAVLAGSVAAHAGSTFTTGEVNLLTPANTAAGGVNFNGTPYYGSVGWGSGAGNLGGFTTSDIASGGTLTGTLTLNVYDTYGQTVYLAFGSSMTTVGGGNPTSSSIYAQSQVDNNNTLVSTMTFTLNAGEISYIESTTGTINFGAEADCHLQGYDLTLNVANPTSTPAPDSASTAILLGGVMTVVAWMKRKTA